MIEQNLIFPELIELYQKSDSFTKKMFADVVDFYLYKKEGNLMDTIIKYFGYIPGDQLQEIISPYVNKKVKDVEMSYGIEPFGYTLRLGTKCLNGKLKEIDTPTVIKPGKSLLVSTLETVNIPVGCPSTLHGKTSYLRQLIIFSFGDIEPGYKGTLSFPIYNAGENDVKLFPNQGLCQIKIFRNPQISDLVYDGKYQDSKGVQGAKFV